MDYLAYVYIPGNAPGKRIGIVNFFETGYYPTNYDLTTNTEEAARRHVHILNNRLGIPDDVAESALYGSMFGWKVPAAQKAVNFSTRIQPNPLEGEEK